MIQRIQTIYLALAFVLSGILIFVFDLWSVNTNKIFVFDLFDSKQIIEKGVPVLFLVSALLSVITIFLFKDRKLQFVLGRVNIMINLLLLGILVYSSTVLSGGASASEKGIGLFIPVVVVLLLVLANKSVKRDEDLVKSVDRLR